jgi:26S proteasome non-ATPase regulatory subunit 9
MLSPLVDPEGFPRADIDVAGVRTARHQINCLRNDLKAVMGEMSTLLERGLPRAEVVRNEDGTETRVDGVTEIEELSVEARAWAKVDAVSPNSPASSAGLHRDDTIISLGDINADNNDNLKGLAALVGRSEGVSLPLVIRRNNSTLHLRLTPQGGWGGRGLLG